MICINISILVYALIATGILLMGCLMEYSVRKSTFPYFIPVVICTIITQAADLLECIAALYESGPDFWRILHGVGYIASTISFHVLFILFVRFLIQVIQGLIKGVTVPAWLDRANIVMCGISAGCWCASFLNGRTLSVSGSGAVSDPVYMVGQSGGAIVLTLIMLLIFKYRRGLGLENSLALLSFAFFPVLALIVQTFFVDVNFVSSSLSHSLILVNYYLNIRQTIYLKEKETRLASERISAMKSRISPHFVFNILNSIYYLCDQDPELAKQSIADFSEHLRANISTLESIEPVPMKKEMENINHYLSLEQMRFQDELEVIYDLEYTDFSVPPLSILPLVENAVRHGAMMNEDGGSVKIGSYLRDSCIEVVITDNGPGFDDPNDFIVLSENQPGLRIVKERLREMLGADLIIESIIGQGNCVTVKIPM